MRFPTASQMIDSNTVEYWAFDGNLNSTCGSSLSVTSSGEIYTTVGTYPGGGEIKTVYSNYEGYYKNGVYSTNIGSYIKSNICTIDFVFRVVKSNPTNGAFFIYLDTGTNDSCFCIGINSSGIAANNRWNVGTKYMAYHSYLGNNFHHLAMTKNGNTLTFYLDGYYKYTYTWSSINWNTNIGIAFNNNSAKCIDMLYFRISSGIRYTEEFIGNTPIDDIFYNIKEKDNEIYGLKTKSELI